MTCTVAGGSRTERGHAADREIAAAVLDRLRAATGDSEGVTRLAYSERETLALDVIEAAARQLDLSTERDAGANLVMTLEGTDPRLPFVACGSHVDSVPQGGNFDGAAGIVAGLALLAGFRSERLAPRRTIKVYALRGEESARFGRSCMGSSALLGTLAAADLAARASDTGRALADCMRDVGVDVGRVQKGEPLLDRTTMAAWLELHIEQGPELVARGAPVSVVTGIRGNVRHRAVECVGEAGHSGAVSRRLRRDAVFATAELLTRLDRHWSDMDARGEDLVVTSGVLGTLDAEHAIARIPGKVRFSFEARSLRRATLDAFHALFVSECCSVGAHRGVEFLLDRRLDAAPAAMDGGWTERFRAAARGLGLPDGTMASGAGHDAANFAGAGIPSAMVFVRNQNGSHNPRESMEIDDLLAGTAVMRSAVREVVL